ncbi:hypothetical protein CMI37_17780 [Candidatus Pacearchaeota archaeon]|nr:hypothetical protein [Candidatus Pacearchaeota archaeon]|tara:strand:+ start:570 stop:995 length:426 start_codon:yes stop_codon:yes gene_type:complete
MKSWTREERENHLRLTSAKMDLAEVLGWPKMDNLSWFPVWPGGWCLLGRAAALSVQDSQRSINFELGEGVGNPVEAVKAAIERIQNSPERLQEKVRWYCPAHSWEEVVLRGHMHSGCPKCGGYFCEPWSPPVPVVESGEEE